MTDKRKDCPMRHENGNCNVIGGFCTAVNDPICEGLHNAYDLGNHDAALRAKQERICAGQYMDTLECVLGGQCIGPDCPGFEPIGSKPLTLDDQTVSEDGLRQKYIVRKADTGESVNECFVLRPDRDPTAVVALRAYAAATDNATLAADIINWVGAEQNTPLTLDELRKMNGKPVYIVFGDVSWWDIVRFCTDAWVALSVEDSMFLSTYGDTWLAYRHKPEGEQDLHTTPRTCDTCARDHAHDLACKDCVTSYDNPQSMWVRRR